MPILVGGHLRESQNGVLALETVVMGLPLVMVAILHVAVLRRGVLLEAGGVDAVHFGVLASVGHHFVSVRADEVALQAVEMGGLVGHGPRRVGVGAVVATAVDVGPKLLEIATH